MTTNTAAAPFDGEARIERFKPLGEYDWPSTSVQRGVERFVASVKKRLGPERAEEGVDLSRLVATERALLDRIVAPPANKPLMLELEGTIGDWLGTGSDALPADVTAANVRTIVLSPCDDENFLRGFAEERGLAVLDPPARGRWTLSDDLPGDACRDADLIVVPRLEDWFLRTDTTLDAVRGLLDRIDASRGKWLVGCNSWAWQFLITSCDADAVLPEPLTPTAFDAARLHGWLSRLSGAQEGPTLRFVSARSGRDALLDDFERGGEDGNTMSELAQRSLGIPWVAWNMWRASLRTSDEQDPERGAGIDLDGDDAQTLWVTELRDFALPDRQDQEALLVLHALLVHGRLDGEGISATVPFARHTRVVSALVKSGMVRRGEDGVHTCLPAAYPAIRDGLAVAGYPLDTL